MTKRSNINSNRTIHDAGIMYGEDLQGKAVAMQLTDDGSVKSVDPDIDYFEKEVKKRFGDTISVDQKAKSIAKFGVNDSIGATLETVTSLGGNEIYVTTNIIDTISSDNVADTQDIVIEGHTVTGTGTDSVFTFVEQTATLNGQNKVTLSTPLARVSRAYNNNGTDLSGQIYVYQDSAITDGVPDDLTLAHITITPARNQSEKAATTISGVDYYAITNLTGSVGKKQAAIADFFLEVREPGKVFRTVYEWDATQDSGSVQVVFHPPLIVPKNSDVRIRAESSNSDTRVAAQFQGYLGIVTS